KESIGGRFFIQELADTHLSFILNLDWFQPFDGTQYSTGVIYMAISNLPRELRFKAENIMILDILPDGVQISTYENLSEKIIWAALILYSCDIPAAQKLCGYISALVSCYQCEKKAQYEDRHHHFGGIDDMRAGK
ncbi:6161_t:CDS:2, partial [Ambispora leptoticha]